MSFHGAAKGAYLATRGAASNSRVHDYKWFLEQEVNQWSDWVSVPLRRRLQLWRRGFTSVCDKLYDFDTHGFDAYLGELQRYRLCRAINGNHRYLLDDKLSQHWMMAGYPENRPRAFGFVDRGRIHGVSGTEYDGKPVPVAEWVPALVRDESKVVLKQLRGLGGKQVLVCEYDGDYRLNGDPVSEEWMVEQVNTLSGYLATEYVDQHAYADELYPHAANTIRLLTLWDDRADELHTPIAVHRIGTDRSRSVDNWSLGGLSAEIDLETGELGKAAQYPYAGEVPWYSAHPDTGARIEGATVPGWKTVRSTIERIARDNTNIPIIGWDVIVSESGNPIVIEANTGSQFHILQIHRPLLADPHVSRIVSRYI